MALLTNRQQTVRGIRDTIPEGTFLGRPAGAGSGPAIVLNSSHLQGLGIASTQQSSQQAAAGGGGGGGAQIPAINVPLSATLTHTFGSPTSKTDVASIGVLMDAGSWVGGGSASINGYGLAVPATPWSFKVWVSAYDQPNNFNQYGIALGDSSNKIKTFSLGGVGSSTGTPTGLKVDAWTDATTFSAEQYEQLAPPPAMFRVDDDGTNLTYFASHDGHAWTPIFQEGRTAFLASGPTIAGFFFNPQATAIGSFHAQVLVPFLSF